MSFFDKLLDGFKKFQSKIDFTPRLIAISERYASKNQASIFWFVFFIITGLFGLIVPIVQGYLAIILAFSFLGIKPLNSFLKSNKKAISNVGSVLFIVAISAFLFTTGSWALGYSDQSPLDRVMDVVQWGQDDVESANREVFSTLGLDYNRTQRSLSVLDYDDDRGFSTIGSD